MASTNGGDVRSLPQSPEDEQAVLGAMLMSKDAIDTVAEIVGEMDFYLERHREIFKAIVRLHEKSEPVDMLTLTKDLTKHKKLEFVGGVNTLTLLCERCPTAANVEFYAKTVKEKSSSRKLIAAAAHIQAAAYEDTMAIKDQMDQAEAKIFEATEQRNIQGFKAIGEIIGRIHEEVAQLTNRTSNVTGIPYGFDDIDEMTEGMQDSNLIVIGARPSVGKTALALNIAWNCASGNNALERPIPVGVFSLEMTEGELAKRLLCSVSKVNWKKARRGEMTEKDLVKMSRAAASIHEAPIYMNDSSSLTVFELKAEARRLKKNFGIELILIDYLQLIQSNIQRDTREQEVAFISRHLKALSKDLKLPVLCLSQLSRPGKGMENRRPQLSDLRESGAIEQDADVVIFIHRDENRKYELIISKQRNGPIGEVPVTFESWCTSFESIPKEVEESTVEKTIAEKKREWAG